MMIFLFLIIFKYVANIIDKNLNKIKNMTSFHTFIENWKIEPSLEKIIQDKLEEEEDLNYCKQIKGFINKLPEEVQLLVR